MPQQTSTIQILPVAFQIVKERQATGLDWGEQSEMDACRAHRFNLIIKDWAVMGRPATVLPPFPTGQRMGPASPPRSPNAIAARRRPGFLRGRKPDGSDSWAERAPWPPDFGIFSPKRGE